MRSGTKAGIIGGTVAAVLLVAIVPTALYLTGNKQDNLVIWTPWTEGGVQATAMEDAVAAYNEQNGDHLDVEMKYVDGYGAAGEAFKLKIDAGNKALADMPDMYIDYDGTLAILSGYDDDGGNYALNLSEGENALSADWFVDSLTTSGDLIENADKDGLYGLPIAKSSEMLTINAPALVLMLNDFITAGGTVDASGLIMNQVFDAAGGAQDGLVATSMYNPETYGYDIDESTVAPTKISGTLYGSEYTGSKYTDTFSGNVEDAAATVSAADVTQFRTYWAEPTAGTKAGSTITITDDTFKSYEELFKLGGEIMTMYGITGDALYEHFFIGLDASSNYMSAMITSAGGQLSSIDADGNFVYDAITETTSIDAAQRAYNVAVEGIETGSALFKGTAQADQGYTNTKMSKHQAAMVVGSTAGASYDFAYDTDLDGNATPAGAGRGEVVMLSAPTTLSTGDAEANIVQGPNLGAIDRSDNVSKDKDKEYYAEREDETKYFLSWLTHEGTMDDGYGNETTPSSYLSDKSGYIVGTTEVAEGGFADSVTNADGTINSDLMNAGTWDGDTFHQDINKYKIGPAIAFQNLQGNTQVEAYGVHSDEFRNMMPSELAAVRDNTTKGSPDHKEAADWTADLQEQAANDGWIDAVSRNSNNKVVLSNKN